LQGLFQVIGFILAGVEPITAVLSRSQRVPSLLCDTAHHSHTGHACPFFQR
jgi:hypothetical protein